MWRSAALTVTLAAVAAGCGMGGGSGAGSTGGAATAASTSAGPPYHSVVVRGTRTFSTHDLAVPLTVHCPQAGPGGFTQVLNDPWKAGSTGGAATAASTSAGPPSHSVVVRGTRTFSTHDLAVPLTVHCPQAGPGGFTQVLNDPWKAGMNGIYHGANGSGMVFAVDDSGTVRISC